MYVYRIDRLRYIHCYDLYTPYPTSIYYTYLYTYTHSLSSKNLSFCLPSLCLSVFMCKPRFHAPTDSLHHQFPPSWIAYQLSNWAAEQAKQASKQANQLPTYLITPGTRARTQLLRTPSVVTYPNRCNIPRRCPRRNSDWGRLRFAWRPRLPCFGGWACLPGEVG